jgi:20S proteasome alpha/beta subunit
VGDSRGTMILAVCTDHGVYLACDSRVTNPSSDSAQKIFQCGASAFIAIIQ